jgi:hypothetical protein
MSAMRWAIATVLGVVGCNAGDDIDFSDDGDTFVTVGDVASGMQSSTITGGDGSSGDATASGSTGTSDSSAGEASADASSGGGSSESASAGSDGGMLDACQHGWDFSRCPDGWEVSKADPAATSEPSWACGDPSGTPAQGGAHLGVWATNLAGDYLENESSALTSPSFSLADCEGATIYLTFAHLYEFGSGDGGTVQVSTDGGASWTTVAPSWHGYCGGMLGVPWSPPGGEPGFCNGDDETWVHSLVEIDDLGGEPDVRVRFVMGSDGIIEQVGWYVDSVAIEAY